MWTKVNTVQIANSLKMARHSLHYHILQMCKI